MARFNGYVNVASVIQLAAHQAYPFSSNSMPYYIYVEVMRVLVYVLATVQYNGKYLISFIYKT